MLSAMKNIKIEIKMNNFAKTKINSPWGGRAGITEQNYKNKIKGSFISLEQNFSGKMSVKKPEVSFNG